MIERKKKLRLIQFFLLFVGLLIIYLTYYGQNPKENEAIISKSLKEKVSDKDKNDEGNAGDKDIFKCRIYWIRSKWK